MVKFIESIGSIRIVSSLKTLQRNVPRSEKHRMLLAAGKSAAALR